MRDMAPRGDRSIRNIPVSSSNRKRATRFEAEQYEEESPQESRLPRRRRRGSRLFMLSVITVVIIFSLIGLLLSTLFAGASVVVYPRTASVSQSVTLSAEPNTSAGDLPYETITISGSATTSVSASGTQKVSRQASGALTIYNNYSAEVQRLIANTRFEAPDGKIYRIHDSVEVPGMKDGKPGSTVATVYADSPGPEYNRGQTRFTIPGFKSDPRYSKFYAEASSIIGGFVGNEPAVAQADLDAAKTTLAQRLEDGARNTFSTQVKEDYILVENAMQMTYSDIRQTLEDGGKVALSQTLTVTAAILRASDLATAVAEKSVEGYGGEAVAFTNPKAVKAEASADTRPVGKIEFTVTGASEVVWQYDKNAIKTALLGKKKDTFESIITSFRPALTGAEVTIRPFWQATLPADPDKITVTEGVKK